MRKEREKKAVIKYKTRAKKVRENGAKASVIFKMTHFVLIMK